MTRLGRRLSLLALLLAVLAGGAPTAVSAKPPQTSLPAMEQQVMCVLCRTPLSVANGPQADAQRRQIRRLIAEGKGEQEIKDVLVAQYGDRVLALPKDEGFNLAVYLVPILAVAVAVALLALALPRWRRESRARAAGWAGSDSATPLPSAEDMQRLDEDLARRD